MVSVQMMHDSIWFDRPKFEQEEENYQLFLNNHVAMEGETSVKKDVPKKEAKKAAAKKGDSLAGEIEKAREAIEHTLSTSFTSSTTPRDPIASRVEALERENSSLRELLDKLTLRVGNLEQRTLASAGKPVSSSESAPPAAAAKEDDDDDDDDDLWGSDDEEEETEEEKRIKEERLAAYAAKKATKKVVIAKSEVTLDCKPWELETDMKKMEECVRSIEMDGLLWAKGSKLIDMCYGLKKLQIKCVIEDDKISTDDLQEKIAAFKDLVQSCDIANFAKI